MITDRQRYEGRHRRIIGRCEQRLRERQEEQPGLTIEEVISDYAQNVRKAIERRDSISAVFATMCGHLAMREFGTNWCQTVVWSPESTTHSPVVA